jgi:hypothetical protein
MDIRWNQGPAVMSKTNSIWFVKLIILCLGSYEIYVPGLAEIRANVLDKIEPIEL